MGDSIQLHDVEGCYQNAKKEVEYDTFNPDLVEQAKCTSPISQANTKSDNEHKPKLYNSPRFGEENLCIFCC